MKIFCMYRSERDKKSREYRCYSLGKSLVPNKNRFRTTIVNGLCCGVRFNLSLLKSHDLVCYS